MANRVEPDIPMDGDSGTGMLVGLTQTFPNGTYYSHLPEGGTSLATSLLAGMLADADQAAHHSLGFVNPLLYRFDASPTDASAAYYDVIPPARRLVELFPAYWSNLNSSAGTLLYNGTFAFEGAEQFCGATCSSRLVTLATTPGFDSMTGIGTPGVGLVPALAARRP